MSDGHSHHSHWGKDRDPDRRRLKLPVGTSRRPTSACSSIPYGLPQPPGSTSNVEDHRLSTISNATDEVKIHCLEEITAVDADDLASISEAWARAGGADKWAEPSSISVRTLAKHLKVTMKCIACQGEDEHLAAQLVFCSCNSKAPFHRTCASKVPNHTPGEGGAEMGWGPATVCEEVPFKTHIFVLSLIAPPPTKDTKILHTYDLSSTWFGTPRYTGSRFSSTQVPRIHLWPRLQTILSQVRDPPARQFPSLVSFIGDTGAGKSTLIGCMIRQFTPDRPDAYQVPVRAAIDSRNHQMRSTSSDVHLYADPGSLGSEDPILFADCKGFIGASEPVSQDLVYEDDGSNDPSGRASSRTTIDPSLSLGLSTIPHSFLRRLGAIQSTAQGETNRLRRVSTPAQILQQHLQSSSNSFDIEWATAGQGNSAIGELTPQRLSLAEVRSMVVSRLYPRILYAFSDVVCYVSNNMKSVEQTLVNLFEWARHGHDRTLNQRSKPGLIILINKATDFTDDMLNIEDNTELILSTFQASARYRDLCTRWQARDYPVSNAKELVLRYYHSFKVITVPAVGPPNFSPSSTSRISQQIRQLYTEIRDMSVDIHAKRKDSHMNLDVAGFSSYLEQSIQTLAHDYRSSIDFFRLSETDTALPRSFSDHVSLVIKAMVKNAVSEGSEDSMVESNVLENITPYIACCIKSQVPPGEDGQELMDELISEAGRGVERFHQRFWRCEATKGGLRCKNYWESHGKGHQFYSGTRNRDSRSSVDLAEINVGSHKSSYDDMKFRDNLQDAIADFQHQKDAVASLRSLATSSGVASLSTQRTCLACLRNCPTTAIPCATGHSACGSCIYRYNQCVHADIRWTVEIDRCPIGCRLLVSPWKVRVKPPTAAPRILALDGGGVRGIVELAILDKIVRKVGHGIPIQELFDLAIGTSTGGIVALAMFERSWDPERTKTEFYSLADKGFSARMLKGMGAGGFLKYQYRSQGINLALQTAFGEKYLFGGCTDSIPSSRGSIRSTDYLKKMENVKVGVIAAVPGQGRPCLLANYSRNPGGDDDILQRTDNREDDFKTWEAARATSAAPAIFKPYRRTKTSPQFIDGAVVANNPVQIALDESRLIWGKDVRPDMILSVGTGFKVDPKSGRMVSTGRNPRLSFALQKMHLGNLAVKLEAGLEMILATLDCHRAWDTFKSSIASDTRLRRNCHRVDVGLINGVPKLDAVTEMPFLNSYCDRYLGDARLTAGQMPYFNRDYPNADAHLDVIARRLRASLFYCLNSLASSMERGTYRGKIHCRLTPGTDPARSLVRSNLRFRLKEDGKGDPITSLITVIRGFDSDTLTADVNIPVKGGPGHFERSIEVSFESFPNHASMSGVWEPISGF